MTAASLTPCFLRCQGLYFQGVGSNLQEAFGFEAQRYNDKMIVVAPQLSDWGDTSADQTIALVEYFLTHYNIDPDQVYANGYSGGGETMSRALGKRPDLFTAYLHCSSQWDGDYQPVADSRTPVYLVVGESDEYYGAQPTREAYEQLRQLYEQQGLSQEEISQLLVLDIKDADYFRSGGTSSPIHSSHRWPLRRWERRPAVSPYSRTALTLAFFSSRRRVSTT